MSRPRHSKKQVESALQYAEQAGWTIIKSSGGRAHCWGKAICPAQNREGDTEFINCTPANPERHANKIRRAVDLCQHVPPENDA